jgi:hypothetical protein
MCQRFLCGAALALAAAFPVHAQTTWEFSYTGFSDGRGFHPDYSLSGFFIGNDIDRNGLLEQSELQSFYWDGLSYALQGEDYCGSVRCELQSFSYSLDGQLDFSTRWTYSDEHSFSSGSTVAGRQTGSAGWAGGGPVGGTTWYWTDATRFAINPPPVPEPAGAGMLAAGLLALAGLRTLRRPRRKVRQERAV